MDYIVGAVVGAIIGAFVAWLNYRKRDGGATPKSGGGPGSED